MTQYVNNNWRSNILKQTTKANVHSRITPRYVMMKIEHGVKHMILSKKNKKNKNKIVCPIEKVN